MIFFQLMQTAATLAALSVIRKIGNVAKEADSAGDRSRYMVIGSFDGSEDDE